MRSGFGVFWNFAVGGTSSSKAQNPPFLQSTSIQASPTAYGITNLLRDGLPPPPPGVDPNRPPSGSTRSIYEVPWARGKLYGGWQVTGIVSAAASP